MTIEHSPTYHDHRNLNLIDGCGPITERLFYLWLAHESVASQYRVYSLLCTRRCPHLGSIRTRAKLKVPGCFDSWRWSLDLLVTEWCHLHRNGSEWSLHRRLTCDHVDVARRLLDVDCREHGLEELRNARERRCVREQVHWVQDHRDVELRSNASKRKAKNE